MTCMVHRRPGATALAEKPLGAGAKLFYVPQEEGPATFPDSRGGQTSCTSRHLLHLKPLMQMHMSLDLVRHVKSSPGKKSYLGYCEI